ncbi:MAG: glycosyltransferase family 2 protein [Lachnospiraceae bacterium]|nr:glycosyltransferase family 2 protein [Lachnospiraceae bacterium]
MQKAKQKVLSIAVPSYNSESYMRHCIDTLLVAGEDVEILVVNDGSKDSTADIANEYAEKYPTIVKAIHQENAGHGGAVNTGLKNATGVFFKVVDSDDWVDTHAYAKLIKTMKEFIANGQEVDMLISNYVYEKVDAKKKRVIHYRNNMPIEQLFTWDDIGHFKLDQYILMHSVIYRTQLLKDCELELPKHTFYVDNIFVFFPLPYVKTMYYVDVNFYRYFIGRSDQSVTMENMIKRIDQQIKVSKMMIDYFDYEKITNKRCRYYMINYLKIMMMVPSIMLVLAKTDEALEKKKELWQYLKNANKKLWFRIRRSRIGIGATLPGPVGRFIQRVGYRVYRRMIGFN